MCIYEKAGRSVFPSICAQKHNRKCSFTFAALLCLWHVAASLSHEDRSAVLRSRLSSLCAITKILSIGFTALDNSSR